MGTMEHCHSNITIIILIFEAQRKREEVQTNQHNGYDESPCGVNTSFVISMYFMRDEE